MKRKIFIRFFAVTLVAVLLMFAFGIIAVKINTKNVLKERLKEETELAAELWKDKGEFASFKKYENITPSEYKVKTERKDLNHED